MATTIITYGTFDLFHIGHLNLLRRLKALGDRLIVGVSTDDFNARKGKRSIVRFEDRLEIVRSLECVDAVIAEHDWEQKPADIQAYNADIFAIGDDWEGKFDDLKAHCEVVYLPRTEGVSSTELKRLLKVLEGCHMDDLKQALGLIKAIVERFE